MTLVLAIPSKGRLRAPTEARLENAGHPAAAPTARSYATRLEGLPGVQLLLVEAAAIPGVLARGEAHAGITGTDLATEWLPDPKAVLEPPLPLGYGQAQLALAVPECWIDVDDVADLDDAAFAFHRDHGRRLRIATGFPRLAQRFLIERAGAEYEIVTSRGPTEAAPLAGLAEAVIDLVATGQTLRANRLKRPEGGVILKSEACFWVSRTAEWSDPMRETLAILRTKLAGSRTPAC